MRHNKKFNHLSRSASHRRAMLANMAISLIRHKRINTTVAKAKALRKYVEPLLTRSKNDTTHSRRVVFSYLHDKSAITELFQDISQKIAERPGGYTRIIKTYARQGDGAEMCFIELVDYDENMAKTPKAQKKTRRSRRSKGSETAAPQEAKVEKQEEVVETQTEEVTAQATQEEVVEAHQEVVEAPKEEEPQAQEEVVEAQE
ncbi:MAG: 50S ribosomal protein L17, partial [Prevotella sp.]|nr:50S ribosomal protein L17 [Prevotella sp.]